MKIALIGYGKMGRKIEEVAQIRGHRITAIIDQDNLSDITKNLSKSAEVAIEFTTPESAPHNIRTCLEMCLPVVSGTTGWQGEFERISLLCNQMNGSLFYSSNFSLGVNIMFRINKYMASLMKGFEQYRVSISETHHIHKKDAPSGTAISLATGIISEIPSMHAWSDEEHSGRGILPISSIRKGEVFGDHTVCYESDADTIFLSHSAKSRYGFALGAVLAAEFLSGKHGVFSMDDLLNLYSGQ
jgi:4-hydroxy-tetrahydrodipicolinate reductase